jgi:hypothetical protein
MRADQQPLPESQLFIVIDPTRPSLVRCAKQFCKQGRQRMTPARAWPARGTRWRLQQLFLQDLTERTARTPSQRELQGLFEGRLAVGRPTQARERSGQLATQC